MNIPSCTIQWNSLSPAEWEERFSKIPRSNLLQSYDYARAICPKRNMRGRWGLIKLNGVEAGLVQILEAGFLRHVFHALIIDRGPLWFEGYGSEGDFMAFMHALTKTYPKRIGRSYRIIPEMQNNDAVRVQLQKLGFREKSPIPYQTIWLDLRRSLDSLKANLKKSWRNQLSRAEKSDINVSWHTDSAALKSLLKNYAIDRAAKGYNGASVDIIVTLAKTMLPAGKMMIGHAVKDGKEIASILILLHGRSATYQIGWTSDQGRDLGAQNLLLWKAMDAMKTKGILDFDLGGINDDGAKGVKYFKDAMGGEPVTLGGLFR